MPSESEAHSGLDATTDRCPATLPAVHDFRGARCQLLVHDLEEDHAAQVTPHMVMYWSDMGGEGHEPDHPLRWASSFPRVETGQAN